MSFASDATPNVFAAGETHAVLLTLRNTGMLTWRREELFRVSYHWLDEHGKTAVRDGIRTELPRAVAPGETVSLCATVVAPNLPGRYELQWDMVHEKHAWFSSGNPVNALRKTVVVESESGTSGSAGPFLVSLAFWGLTLAPLLLAGYWVWALARNDVHNADEHLFYAAIFGVGGLQIVLHVLAFTVGISMLGVASLITLGHATLVWIFGRRVHSSRPLPSLSIIELGASVVMLSLFIQWASAASRGLEILGTDAAHYHVPHALNFFRDVRPFEFLATPHLYPMGTSIWAAWFFQPFDGPLLLELATAPSFLLLCAAMCLLFRLLTNRSGLAWAPWVVLVMFSTHLARLSMLMSADLAYAAGFIAVTAVLLRIWRTRVVDLSSALAAALAAGWLVSSKSTGLLSLAVLFTLAFTVIAVRVRPHADSIRGLNPAVLATALALFIGSGGIWVARNWWMYGSPLAPYGLTILGLPVFPGQSASEMRNYLSVFGDLARYGDEYALGRRFVESVRDMFGAWMLPAGVLGVLVVVDVALQKARRRQLSDSTKTKLVFTAFFAIAFAVHAYVVAGLPWSSLDWTRGLALRYLLPFAFLYLMLLYSFVFMDGLEAYWRSRIVRAAGTATVIAAALYYYSQHQETPGLAPDRWLGMLAVGPLAISAAVVAAVYIAARAKARFPAVGGAIAVCFLATSAVAWGNATDHASIARHTARDARRTSCSATAATEVFEHRELYRRVSRAQQARATSCERTRFFLVSRFDRPLDLQDAGYRNLLLDARVSSARALRRWGPRSSACDVVVATKADIDGRGVRWLDDALKTAGPYEEIAEFGRFAAYVRK